MDAVASLLPETSTPEDRDRSDDIRRNPDMPKALTMAMVRRSFTKRPDITRRRLSFMAPVITVLDITVPDIMVGVGEDGGERKVRDSVNPLSDSALRRTLSIPVKKRGQHRQMPPP